MALSAQDILTAYDSVGHHDVIDTYRRGGASAHRSLSLARGMHEVKVELDIPYVAETEGLPMTKVFKTGGKAKPNMFVDMFETVFDHLTGE